MIKNAVLLLALTFLVACQKSGQKQIHAPLTGTLEKSIQEIHDASGAEPCDAFNFDKKLVVVKALDAKEKELEELVKNNPQTKYSKIVPFGKTFISVKTAEPPPSKDEWTVTDFNWTEVFEDYEYVKSQPTNMNWYELSRYVKALLTEDYDRVFDLSNPYINHDSEPQLMKLWELVERCKNNEGCLKIEPSLDLTFFIKNQYYFEDWIRIIDKKISVSEKRAAISKFYTYIEDCYRIYFQFRKSETTHKTSDGQYEIHIDAGDFNDVTSKSQLKTVIEKVWNGKSGQSVKVVWSDSPSNPVVKFILGNSLGGRSSANNGVITLEPGFSMKTVAHEIGHALGFRDRYYFVWDPRLCLYKENVNRADIMSASDSGMATDYHWDKLKEY